MKNFYRDGGLCISIIALVAAVAFLSGCVYFFATEFFWIIVPFVVLIAGFAVGKLIQVTRKTFQYFAHIDGEIDLTERLAFDDFPLAVVIIDKSRQIVWYNHNFKNEFESVSVYGCSIDAITKKPVAALLEDGGKEIFYNGRYYQAYAYTPKEKTESEVYIVYFRDMTRLRSLETELKMSHPVAMIILIDSFEELFAGNAESEKAKITVQIDELLESFIADTCGVMWKVSRDRFFAVIEERHIARIIEEKVKILDKARGIAVTDRINITLSIGIGRTGKTLIESENYAKQALDMALGRGGDQAAIKTENGFEFYGGLSKGVVRSTNTRTRIIANTIIDLIENADSVYIMGHRNSDLDSLGASVGLAAAVRNLGRTAHVVVDTNTTLATQLIDHIRRGEDEKNPLFMPPHKAREQMGDDSLLIICDTHNPQNVEDSELYQQAKTVVVIDHHRKMVKYIDNAIVFYHEPYASSTCEMLTELLRYFGAAGKLTAVEAEAVLAGIMLDTKSFTLRTGVRTFEAAALLRRLGADTVNVKSMFSASLETYRQRGELVGSAKVYKRCAIAVTEKQTEELKLVAPQAADELLAVSDVIASFVIYPLPDGRIAISARSLGAMNVQLVMESLGGGGHQTMAAAQLKDCSFIEAERRLTENIDKYMDENNKGGAVK